MNNHDDDMDGVFAQLGGVRLRGPGHRHQRDEIKARLFGEEPPLRRVGRFILLGDLGHGGMGTVWRAYDEQLDRQVAIKLMRESLRAEHEARLLREAQALARLSHPNVVQVYEVGSVDDQLFIAMELLAGDTLRDWQDRQDQPWRASLDAYVQAGRGLAAAHSADLIHRDFKPSNCMIDPDGRVRVLDFGLACGVDLDHELDASVELTASGEYPASKSGSGSIPSSSSSMLRRRLTQASSLLGTKAYMAPEQLYGMPPSVHSDQFSFCVALYEALYRQLPFSEQPVATLLEMAEGTAHMPQPPTTGSDVPRWLQRAVWRGVSANVQDRWPSMEALLHELEHQLPRPRRRGMMAAGATAAVLGLVGVASMPSSSATLPPCHDAADRLGDPWGPAERQSVRDAIIETDLPYAPQAWSTVERQLEDYTEGLGAAYVHACEATYVRHDQTRADLGLRHTCLDERRDGLVDTIELLGTVEAREVSNVVAAIARAPRIEDCSEPEALARATAGSGSEAARELRRELERVRALRYIGRHERALDQLAPILARAEHLGDRGLVAEAVYLDGELRVDTGADDIANERFTAARALALTHARDEVVIQAESGLARLLGIQRAQVNAALLMASSAEALAQRDGITPTVRAAALTAGAQVLTHNGEHRRALDKYAQASSLLEAEYGAHHIALVETLDGQGTAFDAQGDLAQAEAAYRRAIEIRSAWQGARHPATAYLVTNLAVVLVHRGEYEQAIEQYESALVILQSEPTPNHGRLAHTYANLGAASSRLGRLHEAEQQLQTALGHFRTELGPIHPSVALAHFNLGVTRQRQGRLLDARQSLQRADEILEQSEPTVATVRLQAKILRHLGVILDTEGDSARARTHYQRAVTLLESKVGARDPALATAINRLGRHLRASDAVQAEQLHRRAMDIYAADGRLATRMADTLRFLARALMAQGQLEPARYYATRALDLYETVMPAPRASHVEDAESLLDEVHSRRRTLK